MTLTLTCVIYSLFSAIFDFILSKIFGMRPLSTQDLFLLQFGDESIVYLIMRVDRIDFDQFKIWITDHWSNHPEMRVQLTHRFGRYYWEQLEEKEFKKRLGKTLENSHFTNIHSKQDLKKHINNLINTNSIDLFTELPYGYTFISDYSSSSSYICSFANHTFLDGLSVLSSFNCIRKQRNSMKDPEKSLSYYIYHIIGHMLLPITFPLFAIYLMTLKRQNNCIQGRDLPADGQVIREVFVSEEYDRRKFKEQCVKVGCNPVEAGTTLLGMAVREYAQREHGERLEEIQTGFLFANRLMSPSKLETGNNIIFPNIKLNCEGDFSLGLLKSR